MTGVPASSTQEHRASAWRGVLFFLPLVLWSLAVPMCVALVAVVWPAFRREGVVRWVRIWGRVPLALCAVRLEVHGLEHRDRPGPKLILFNHVSLLDLYVLAAICPDRMVALYKRELHRIPGLGLGMRMIGMIPVDRGDLGSAIASIDEAGRRLREEGAACYMAPEGTRSRLGGLQPFKLGAFHLAAQTHIPVVPLVMRGIEEVLPMGSFLVRSGVVRADFLPPIDTTAWERETVRQHARELRELFLEYLPAAPERAAAD